MEPLLAGVGCLVALAVLAAVRPLLSQTSLTSGLQETITSNLHQTLERSHHPDTEIRVKKLDPSLLPAHGNKRRLIVVGDVHGCVNELKSLLQHISFDKTHDHLILAGDLINKGPDSKGVLHLVRSLNASCVRGNHEDKILRAHAALASETTTLLPRGSGEGNMADELARSLSKEDIEYIRSWPIILDLGQLRGLHYGNGAVVHAGLIPGMALEDQEPFVVMNMRAIKVHKKKADYWDMLTGEETKGKGKKGSKGSVEYVPSEDREKGEKWWSVWNDFQARQPKTSRMLCVYGHDSKQGLVEKEYSVGLDSGCVKGERLSALIVEEKSMRVESVHSKKDYTADRKK